MSTTRKTDTVERWGGLGDDGTIERGIGNRRPDLQGRRTLGRDYRRWGGGKVSGNRVTIITEG